DVGADHRQRLDIAARVDIQADLPGGKVERFTECGRERHHRDRRRVDAEQQVQHRGVADDDGFIDALSFDTGRFVQLLQDRVHGALNDLAQLRLRLIPLHAVADAGYDVR